MAPTHAYFQASVAPKLLDEHTYALFPQTTAQKFELTFDEAVVLVRSMAGIPIRLAHKPDTIIGKVKHGYIHASKGLCADLEVDLEHNLGFATMINNKDMIGVSLAHNPVKMLSREVTICMDGMRDGTGVNYRISPPPDNSTIKSDEYSRSGSEPIIYASRNGYIFSQVDGFDTVTSSPPPPHFEFNMDRDRQVSVNGPIPSYMDDSPLLGMAGISGMGQPQQQQQQLPLVPHHVHQQSLASTTAAPSPSQQQQQQQAPKVLSPQEKFQALISKVTAPGDSNFSAADKAALPEFLTSSANKSMEADKLSKEAERLRAYEAKIKQDQSNKLAAVWEFSEKYASEGKPVPMDKLASIKRSLLNADPQTFMESISEPILAACQSLSRQNNELKQKLHMFTSQQQQQHQQPQSSSYAPLPPATNDFQRQMMNAYDSNYKRAYEGNTDSSSYSHANPDGDLLASLRAPTQAARMNARDNDVAIFEEVMRSAHGMNMFEFSANDIYSKDGQDSVRGDFNREKM